MNLSGKKLFLIGFIVVLLIGIPLTVYLLQQQTNTQQHAEASTNLAFNPASSATSPIQKNVGDSIPLDISVDPGKNLVSFVKLEIQYDPTVLATPSASAFTPNTVAFPSVLEGPVFTPGKIAVTLSVGPDPTKAIQQKVTAGTITFKALKDTPPGTPTLVTFTSSTQVLSIGSSDQASENVLSSATPATIAIGGASAPSESIPPGTPTPAPSVAPSAAPTSAPSAAPTAVPGTSPTPTSVPASGAPNQPPTCNSLVLDRSGTGNAPYTLTFTANGSDSDGTINKVSFNFGDGGVSDVTQSGGIGTSSVNVQMSHTYTNPGSYTATAVLTDNGNSTSSPSTSCQQDITINQASSSGSTGGSVIASNPTPTMPPTGSTGLAIGLGLGAMLLILGGGLLFFIL
jgi:PKD domain